MGLRRWELGSHPVFRGAGRLVIAAEGKLLSSVVPLAMAKFDGDSRLASMKSGVREYEIEKTFLKVRFRHSADVYVYTARKPGRKHVEEMKTLAQRGRGLSTYISQQVRGNYAQIE